MNNELDMIKLFLPDWAFEFDSNGEPIALSQLGCFAVALFAVSLGQRIFKDIKDYLRASGFNK